MHGARAVAVARPVFDAALDRVNVVASSIGGTRGTLTH